ncbi:hypothetical protein D3C72_826300 [compost metagenome]
MEVARHLGVLLNQAHHALDVAGVDVAAEAVQRYLHLPGLVAHHPGVLVRPGHLVRLEVELPAAQLGNALRLAQELGLAPHVRDVARGAEQPLGPAGLVCQDLHHQLHVAHLAVGAGRAELDLGRAQGGDDLLDRPAHARAILGVHHLRHQRERYRRADGQLVQAVKLLRPDHLHGPDIRFPAAHARQALGLEQQTLASAQRTREGGGAHRRQGHHGHFTPIPDEAGIRSLY